VLELIIKNSTWYQSSVPERAIAQATPTPFQASRHLLAATAKMTLTLFLVKLVLALSLEALGLISSQTGTA
jgi:hypothetical protein